MYYETEMDIIMNSFDRVNMHLFPAIAAKGDEFGVSVWVENHSFTETGEVDLYAAAVGDDCEERLLDLLCWVHNEYGYDAA